VGTAGQHRLAGVVGVIPAGVLLADHELLQDLLLARLIAGRIADGLIGPHLVVLPIDAVANEELGPVTRTVPSLALNQALVEDDAGVLDVDVVGPPLGEDALRDQEDHEATAGKEERQKEEDGTTGAALPWSAAGDRWVRHNQLTNGELSIPKSWFLSKENSAPCRQLFQAGPRHVR
jgi:hypothetical protein